MERIAHRLPAAWRVLQDGVASGLHDGGQVYVIRDGRAVIDDGFGLVRPDQPMAPDVVMPWMSAGKPVMAVVVARLWEAGALSLDDRVSRYLPEFAANGKVGVTLRHLLTHTSGFPAILARWRTMAWDEVIASIC